VSSLWLTVVIPTYNRKDQVTRAIDSALAGGEPGVEIIVVDDCSTDGTVELLEERYAGQRSVRIVRAGVRGGPSRARNVAIGLASGQWFLLLDSDCELLPNGIQAVREEVHKHPNAPLLYFSCIASPGGQRLDSLPSSQAITHADLILSRVQGEFLPVASLTTLKSTGLRFPPLKCGAESLLWIRLTRQADALFTARPLIKYGVAGSDRLCVAPQQVTSAPSLALAAITHATMLKREGFGNTSAFRERVLAAGVYSVLSQRVRRGRRLLWFAAWRGSASALPALVVSAFGRRLFLAMFLRYRSR
jgi:hypothetical protein